MNQVIRVVAVCGLVVGVGCAGGQSSVRPDEMRAKLRAAFERPVDSRDARDEQSKLMVDLVDGADLDGLNEGEVRAALGKGRACRTEVCSRAGFSAGDWYYELGIATSDDVEQLPTLIIGFDMGRKVSRVWTLTTH